MSDLTSKGSEEYNFEILRRRIENLREEFNPEEFQQLSKERKIEKIENDMTSLKKYYDDQLKICLKSSLYGERSCDSENQGKVLMLFSEMYPLLVDCYGIGINPEIIIRFSNSRVFKKWFGDVKYKLGIEIHSDPNSINIHKWIARGLFLKSSLSLIFYSQELPISEFIIIKLIEKQKKIVDDLLKHNYFIPNGRPAIINFENGYFLLGEKTVLSYQRDLFFDENVIKD